ncbi:hypothetical protein VTN02DRAFT_1471 [Thermoascus thermophilus]
MRSIVLVALSALALASQESSSAAVTNPETPYLTQTNSYGVVTGQPTPQLSQQGAASIPAGLSTAVVVPSSGATTVLSVAKPFGTGSSHGRNSTALRSGNPSRTVVGPTSTGTGTASASTSTGGAALATAGPLSLGLGLAGAAVAAFL